MRPLTTFTCLLSLCLLATATPGALAQNQAPPRAYAVISEIAREASVVSFQETTGSRLNNNMRQRLPVPDGALDKVALVTAQQALKKEAPGASVWLLAPASADFFGALPNLAVGDSVKIPDDLAAAFKENRTSHLLLFKPFRAEAKFQFANWSDGAGSLDGLGFYVDRSAQVFTHDTKVRGIGYLAPYVYFRASVIDVSDVAKAKVISTQSSTATQILNAGDAKDGSGHPWEVLTPAEKMKVLAELLQAETKRLVPLLLKAP